MTKDITKAAAVADDIMLFDNWFDPIEDGVRTRVRGFIETRCWRRSWTSLYRARVTDGGRRLWTQTPLCSSAAGTATASAC